MPAPLRHPSPAALAVLLLAAMAMLGAGGCAVSQRVTLEPEGSGRAEVRIRLQQVLLDYLLDLSEVSGSKEKGRIFDVEDIRKGFASRQEVTLRRIESASPDRLEMDLAFQSIEKLFAAPEYLELIDLALGEGGAAALKASAIETTILVKGRVVAQSGGTTVPGGVAFRIPLLRVLLLDKPLAYSLPFKYGLRP